jgi:hypothetical protein
MISLQSVRQCSLEDVRWQIVPPNSAERTRRSNPGVRHRADRSRYVLAAFLALHGVVTVSGLGQAPHATSIGEYKTKLFTSWPRPAFRPPDLHVPLTNCAPVYQKKGGIWELIGVDFGRQFGCFI